MPPFHDGGIRASIWNGRLKPSATADSVLIKDLKGPLAETMINAHIPELADTTVRW